MWCVCVYIYIYPCDLRVCVWCTSIIMYICMHMCTCICTITHTHCWLYILHYVQWRGPAFGCGRRAVFAAQAGVGFRRVSQPPSYWFLLMYIDVYWCILMYIDVYWCILMYIDVHRRLYQIPVFRLGWPWFAHSHDRSLCFRNLVLWIPNAELFDPPKQVGETLGRRELQIGSSDPQRNGWCWISVPLKLPGVNRRWACVPSQTDVQQ